MLDERAVADALAGCTACVHTAAVTSMEPNAASDAIATNARGARIVFDAAIAAGCDPIVHLSSISALRPPPGSPFSVDSPVSDSAQPYAQSKADSEHMARALQDAGHPIVIIYPSGVCGPTDVGVHVNAAGYAMLLAQPFVMVPETGGNLVVDVRDLATGTVALLTPGRGPRRYLAGGHFLPWPQNAEVIDRVTGLARQHVVMGPAQMGEFLDEELVESMLNIVPADDAPFLRDAGLTWRPVEDTLADMLRWTIERGVLGAEWAPALAP